MITSGLEVPFVPWPKEPGGGRIEPPLVPVAPRWEYQELVRDAESAELPSESELNALGGEGWELAGLVSRGSLVHFYFKRERLG